jgi:predicted extracellular nuclease
MKEWICNKKIIITALAAAVILLNGMTAWSQEKKPAGDYRYLRFVFYNVENYFDAHDDSLTNDEEFTPEGTRHWTYTKYKQKQKKIYQVLAAAGGWELPDIMGFCEIENRYVMEDLINSTPLKYYNYDLVHKESPDRRGIDVALIYRTGKLKLLNSDFIRVVFPFDTAAKTRDILYASLRTLNDDTLHFFINHWPSRMGGQAESDARRQVVAGILRLKVDSLFGLNPAANIVIAGDFNDEPDNNSIIQMLGAKTSYDNPQFSELYNLSWYLKTVLGKGSYKYQGSWGLIDQIIVSGALLKSDRSIYTQAEKAGIFEADFLSETDEQYIGVKPFRTFAGFRFHGGFSDHYPVFLDFLDN